MADSENEAPQLQSEIHAEEAESYLALAKKRGVVRDIDRCIAFAGVHATLAVYYQNRQD